MSASIRRRGFAIRMNSPAASASASAIARAVVLEPNFVVLDEPTSALDMLFQAQMVDLLRELQRKRDLTYMFISHDLRVVASLASHLIVMRHGKVVEEGPAVGVVQESEDRLHPRAVRRRVPAGNRARRGAAATLTQPLDRGDLAAGGLDAGDGVAGVFDHGRHVMGVGMNDGVGVAHDRDMAFPEDQIAALQFLRFRRVQRPAEAVLLHVAVARAAGAGGIQRDLDQAGAIDSKAALAAPQIGRADKTFGHRDEIVLILVDACRDAVAADTSLHA